MKPLDLIKGTTNHQKTLNRTRFVFCIAIFLTLIAGCTMLQKKSAEPPQPYGALPSERQLKWHYETEFYGFIHFTINTFTDKEWGFGDENPVLFNPTMFDANKIVRSFKSAGMTGLILTCKHHDGFCLWPTKTTERSIKNSPWKDGKGDLVKEISDACRKNDMKFGVYVSPWDRSQKDFAKPGYLPVFREQLTELLTNYGPVFQVWWDGAVGKDGFYGGTREQRDIDRNTYFGFPEMIQEIVRKYQPEACVFTEVGPEIRWVGNESGWAGDPCWATFTPRYRGTTRELEINPETGEYFELPNGLGNYTEATNGHRNGKFWIPAETDVSIRPGWFWHKAEDIKVRSLDLLLKIYFESVGRGTSLNLNVPPDSRGLINGIDSVRLEELGSVLYNLFATNLAASATVTASNTRSGFPVENLFDGMRDTYWATDDSITTPDVTLNFKAPVTFDVVRIREFLPLGQRVDDWAFDSWQEGEWKEFAKGTAIGSCRLVRMNQPVTTEKVRLRITKSPVCPSLAEFGLYKMPDSAIPADD